MSINTLSSSQIKGFSNQKPSSLKESRFQRVSKPSTVSFTGKYAVTSNFGKFLVKHEWLQDLIKSGGVNAAICEAAFVALLATTIRPLSIAVIPGAKKEDKQYASTKSIATGIVDFAMACMIYMPLSRSCARLGTEKRLLEFFKESKTECKPLLEKFFKKGESQIPNGKIEQLFKDIFMKSDSRVLSKWKIPGKNKTFLNLKQTLEKDIPKILEKDITKFTEKDLTEEVKTELKGLKILIDKYKPVLEDQAKKIKTDFPYEIGSNEYKTYSWWVNYGSKIIIAPISSYLLFQLIPPIMDKIYPNKNKNNSPAFVAKLSQAEPIVFSQFEDSLS